MEAVEKFMLLMKKEVNKMDFNFGNLASAAVGAVANVAVTIAIAIAEAAIGALAAVAEAREDGELSDEQAEELFEEKFKALLGAYMLSIGSESSGSTSNSDNILELPTYTPGAWGPDGNRNTSVNMYKDGDRVKILAGNGEYFAATVRTHFGGIELEIDDLDGYKEAHSTESPGVIAKVVSNVENEYNNFLNYYQDAKNAREELNRNEYNNIVADEEELENLQKQSDEMIQKQTYKEIEDAKKVINDPRDTVLLIGPSAAGSDGTCRNEGSAVLAINITNFDIDVLGTAGIGWGTPTVGGAFGFGVAKSEGGIPGLTGGGQNIGGSRGGGADYSSSSSSDAVTLSASLSTGDATSEVHGSVTETYSLTGGGLRVNAKKIEANVEQVKDFCYGYTQHIADQITGADKQYTEEEKMKDVPYKVIDDAFGYKEK